MSRKAFGIILVAGMMIQPLAAMGSEVRTVEMKSSCLDAYSSPYSIVTPFLSGKDSSWLKAKHLTEVAEDANPYEDTSALFPAVPVSQMRGLIQDKDDFRQVFLDLAKGDSLIEAQPFRDVVRAVKEMSLEKVYCQHGNGATLEEIRQLVHARILSHPRDFRALTLQKVEDQIYLQEIEVRFLEAELRKMRKQVEELRDILSDSQETNRKMRAVTDYLDRRFGPSQLPSGEIKAETNSGTKIE